MVSFCVFYSVKCIISEKRRNTDLPPKIYTFMHLYNVQCTFCVILLRIVSIFIVTVSGNCTETFGIQEGCGRDQLGPQAPMWNKPVNSSLFLQCAAAV